VVRVLRERGSTDAIGALDALLSETAVAGPEGATAALAIAVHAEALALKGRWADSDQRYRQAIELMPDLTIRRSWWMNLAEVALRQKTNRADRKPSRPLVAMIPTTRSRGGRGAPEILRRSHRTNRQPDHPQRHGELSRHEIPFAVRYGTLRKDGPNGNEALGFLAADDVEPGT